MQSKRINRTTIKELLAIADRVKVNAPVTPAEVDRLRLFEIPEKESRVLKVFTIIALPGSVLLGMAIASFPDYFSRLVERLPGWTNMPSWLAAAIDYIWTIIGEPVEQQNIIYYIPNIILYSFGVFGIKKIFEYLRKKSWLDKVYVAKESLIKLIDAGAVNYKLNDGHSILFLGNGDFIGQQFYLDSVSGDAIILSTAKPYYTDHWLRYDPNATFSSLQHSLELADVYNCGEYILFPVTDTEIFLPGPGRYDLSPEKIEVTVQAIRDTEKLRGWPQRHIIIIGDKKQSTCIRTETKSGAIDGTTEDVSLGNLNKRFNQIYILDATELIIEQLLLKFPGRRILFRASVEGASEYKQRFYERLEGAGYKENPGNEYSLVVGYDLFDEQIERESIATDLREYMPVVISKEVYDALLRNEYQPDEFIYVPELVLTKLKAISLET